MALPVPQTKQFFFGQGPDSRTENEAVGLGKLLLLQNGKLDKPGVIKKKYGSAATSTTVEVPTSDPYTPSAIPDLKRLLSYKDSLIGIGKNNFDTTEVVPSPDIAFRFNNASDKWVSAGRWSQAGSCVTKSIPVSTPAFTDFNSVPVAVDMAVTGQFICIVKAITNGTIYSIALSILDTNSNEVIYSVDNIASGGLHPRVIAFNSKFYVLWQTGGTNNIVCNEYTPATLGVVQTTPITTAYYATTEEIFFDAGVNGSNIYICYRDNGGTTTIKQFSSLNPVTLVNTVTTGDLPTRHLSLFFSGTMVCLAISRAATFRLASWSSTLVAVTAPFTAYNAVVECGYGSDQTIGGKNLIVVSEGTTVGNFNVRTATWDPTTGALTLTFATASLRGMWRLASRPFAHDGRHHYFIQHHANDSQNSLFLIQHERIGTLGEYGGIFPLGKYFYGDHWPTPFLAPGTAGFMTQILTSVSGIGGSQEFCGAFLQIANIPSAGGKRQPNFTQLIRTNFIDRNAYNSKESQNNLLVAGGILYQYDGLNISENGFLLAPPNPELLEAGVGSLTMGGTYQYIFVYEWVDSAGNLHRSAPSLATSITIVGATSAVTITVRDDLLSIKQNSLIRVYRTESNGSIFYAVGTIGVTYGSTFSDTAADSAIIDQAILYTTGGVLENDSMYQVSGVTNFKDRAFLLTNRGVYYSKRFEAGRPTEFSELFTIAVESDGGPITAIAALLDKLLIFKQDKIYFLSGDGPESTGEGSLFSIPELLTSNCGCLLQSSVAEVGDECYFQARDLIWRINGSLQLEPVGVDVDYFFSEIAADNINKTLVIERDREVKFQSDARIFTFNTLTRQWSIETTYGGPSMALWQNNMMRIDSSLDMYLEQKSSWKDGSNFVELRACTGWINLEQITGFQRVWEAILLARFYSNHTLNVKVYYDYLPKVVDSYTYVADSANLAVYTDANLYTDTHYTGTGTSYIFRMKLKKQKCTAIMFEFYDSNQSGEGQSLDLVGLNLKMGIKRPDFKIPAAQSV